MTTKKPATKTAPKQVSKSVVAKKMVAKKIVAKKVPVKKTATKAVCGTGCACTKKCQPTQAFWVNNGPVLKSVDELLKALKEMSDEQYAYHTKRDGNDFAIWIRDCLNDVQCAKDLKNAKTRVGAIRILSGKCACC
jgi:hypothetical protein